MYLKKNQTGQIPFFVTFCASFGTYIVNGGDFVIVVVALEDFNGVFENPMKRNGFILLPDFPDWSFED